MASGLQHRSDDDYGDEKRHLVSDLPILGDVGSIEMVIWTRDRKGIQVTLEGKGSEAEAGDVLQIVKEHRHIPEAYSNVFSVWMVSPLLEFRLKPKHKPFHFSQLWDDFCGLYTDANPEEIERDEPVVMVQRNVFLSLNEERTIENHQVNQLLFAEAKFNVIDGRYILSHEEYEELAKIQAFVELGHYDAKEHTSDFYKKNLNRFFPPHIYKPKKSLLQSLKRNSDDLEDTLMEAHQSISAEYGNHNVDDLKPNLYRHYLEICRKHPFYGAAFFEAVLQKKTGKVKLITNNLLSRGQPEIEVKVAINMEGVTIIDSNHKTIIMALPYEKLSWDLDKNEDEGPDRLPCLLLQFLCGEGEECVTKVLGVYSRQAVMMDKLIESSIFLKHRNGEIKKDWHDKTDGFGEDLSVPMNKLCLTTYTLEGDQLNTDS